MNTNPSSSPSRPPPRLLRSVAIGVLGLAGGISLLASAGGTPPDPPVPQESPVHVALATTRSVSNREPDCRCGVLYARDMESRIEGHVERWEALTQSRAVQAPRAEPRKSALRVSSLVEGVVGFPVRQFRLAADVDSEDDGAGSD